MNLINKPKIRKAVVDGRTAYVAVSKEKIAVFYRPESARDWLMRHTIVR